MSEEARRYVTPQIEKRKHRRVNLVTEVRCEALGVEKILVTRDISEGGVLVSTTRPFPDESDVVVSFRLKPAERAVSCRGRVVHDLAGLGMGIAFLDLSEDDRRRVQKFVDEAD